MAPAKAATHADCDGSASTGAYVLCKIYFSASARIASGDLDGAVSALDLVVDVGPGVSEAQYSRDLALVLRDYSARASVLPQIRQLETTSRNPLLRILAVFADPSQSQLRSDRSLYVTAAGAAQMRSAAAELDTYPAARNGRYVSQFVASGQASGDPSFPVRYTNFGSMVGNGGKIMLGGEPVPFGQLFDISVDESHFAPYGERLIGRFRNGIRTLEESNATFDRMARRIQVVRAQVETGNPKQRLAAISELDSLAGELESFRQSNARLAGQLRIIADNIDARSDVRIVENRRTIQEQQEHIARLRSLTRALQTEAKAKRRELVGVQLQYVQTSKQVAQKQQQYTQLVGEIEARQTKLNAVTAQLAQKEGRLAQSRSASTGLEQQVQKHTDEIAALKAREDALHQQQQAAAKLDQLRQEQTEAAAELSRMQAQVRAAQAAGQGDLASLQQQRNEMAAKLKNLASDVQAGEVGRQKAEATRHELDQLVARKSSVEQQVSAEQTQLAQVQTERRKLQQEVERLHAQQDQSFAEQARLAHAIRGIDFGHYYALVIGNDEYREWPRLHTAVNDAHDISDVLARKYGFRVQTLTNATKRQIVDAINSYIGQLGPLDNLLVYYAGHGVLSNNVGYWVPVDAEGVGASGRVTHPEELVGHEELIAAMQKMKAKEVMVLADSCFSGGLAAMAMEAPRTEIVADRRLASIRTRGLRIVEQDGDVPVKETQGTVVRADMPDRDVAALTHWAHQPARVVLTSGGLEPVADQLRAGDRHSIFAAAVLASLRRNSGLLKSLDLTSAVQDQVVRNASGMSQRGSGGRFGEGLVQTPTYNNLMGYSGQFLFVAQN